MPYYKTADATAPVHSAVAVTPADDGALNPTRALYIGATGDVTVDMAENGTNITFTAVPVGIFPIQVTRVYATGTTATGIRALY